jgi:hypothetical protein
MPSLLDLAREIRDEIVALVITSEISHPSNGTRLRTRDYPNWKMGQHIFIPSSPDAYRPPALSLLLTNKQMHAETLSLIAREKVDVSLDLTFLDMVWLWPAYRTILPRTKTSLNTLVVNVSLAISDESGRINVINSINDAFWSFITRFLLLGPVGDIASVDSDLNIYVRELRVNIDTEKHRTGNYLFSEEEVPTRAVEGFAHLTDQHKWLYGADAQTAKPWIDRFDTTMDSEDLRRPWLTVVHERVGRIVFCVGGQVRREWSRGNTGTLDTRSR